MNSKQALFWTFATETFDKEPGELGEDMLPEHAVQAAFAYMHQVPSSARIR